MKLKFFFPVIIFFLASVLCAQVKNPLHIISKKEVGQIEVGSPYVGIEIHKSFPMLNRISFYYPVANSIDISQDYWKRENYRIMSVGIKVGDSPKEILKDEIYKVDQTPYSVSFTKEEKGSELQISYEFCDNEPALLVTYKITNKSHTVKNYEIFTSLLAILRTSHTYKFLDSANTEYEKKNGTIIINYNNIETGKARIFISNVGVSPASFTTKYPANYSSIDKWWLDHNLSLPEEIIPVGNENKPVASFIYKKKLKSEESIVIKQLIGCIKISDGKKKIARIISDYKKDVLKYKNYVLNESLKKAQFETGDKDLDFTSQWTKAILAVNKHFINGEIVPMPAPAEYNFFFTHDVLLTDLAAVNFDLERVRKDLKFIISLADKDKIIPHAYYWKDTTYQTEFAGPENWNHFWFIILCARYLRHSGNVKFLNELYPYIIKSVETSLQNKGKNGLMWSTRPDWWDIGNNFGPRAYMTILAVKALREFSFINSCLNKGQSDIQKYQKLADTLDQNLIDKLWDNKLKYLVSYYEDGSEDKHIYMGSLLASHFDLLDKKKDIELLNTAKKYLLDERLGIYTLYPMDFNKLIDYMHFSGNEAGAPYYYANGGIWPHGNAWYALALIKNGFNDEAYSFIKKTMTINGIINSPNGQPAMYEYRISDKDNPAVYGKIDKPQFLWAGGWYLYTIYNLFGLRENEWNISFNPYIPAGLNKINFPLTYNNKNIFVEISGKGNEISSISFDGKELPSAIIPYDIKKLKKINIKLGKTGMPYLKTANAKVLSPEYDINDKSIGFTIQSFNGDINEFEIVSPVKALRILSDNKDLESGITQVKTDDLYIITVKHLSEKAENHFKVEFK